MLLHPFHRTVRSCAAVLILSWGMFVLGMSCAVADDPVLWQRVQAILKENCWECHGPVKQVSGLRLDRRESVLRGGDLGEPALVPYRSDASLILQYVESTDRESAMPPPGDGRRRLTEEEIRLLTKWIDEGAEWGATAVDAQASTHWSFQPLRTDFAHADIDAFLEAKQSERGLKPVDGAEPQGVIRRLSFALTGLPPEPARVQQFVQEFQRDRDDATRRVVEEYLASPQYGERWARHWLDVVRFAESDGFEMNHPRPNAWHYRDYVIDAFNRDVPYDQFVREQLAGDQWGIDAATGFLVGGPWDRVKSPDPVLTANQRADELHDMVSTTASAFLGLTVGCARCHSHKFDPIPQADYYRIKACLSGVQHGERTLRSASGRISQEDMQSMRARLAQIQSELRNLEPIAIPGAQAPRRSPVSHRENHDRFRPVKARWVRFEIRATSDAEPCIDELEVLDREGVNVARAATLTSSGNYPGNPIHQLPHINDGLYGNSHSWISNELGKGWVQLDLGAEHELVSVLWSRDRSPEPQFSDRVATEYSILASPDGMQWTVIADASDRLPRGASFSEEESVGSLRNEQAALESQLKRAQEGPKVYAGMLGRPEPVYRLHRGDPMSPKELVVPGGLSSFEPFELSETSDDLERRLALADWIASPKNPLTARVMVNRIWHYHFGVGIVETPSDFGAGGAIPTHPELLDWLAVQFIESGWSIKAIQRLICNTRVYRARSQGDDATHGIDSSNRWLTYFPPRRLEAEPLRDTVLAVCDQLDLRMGGPGFDLFEPNENYVRVYQTRERYGPPEFRRMVYQRKPRVELDQIFGTFDCPDAGQIQPKRNVSTTPLQALNFLNSQFMIDRSQAFADRLVRDAGNEIDAQVERAFWLALSRAPSADEQALSRSFAQAYGLPAFCRAMFNTNEFIMVY